PPRPLRKPKDARRAPWNRGGSRASFPSLHPRRFQPSRDTPRSASEDRGLGPREQPLDIRLVAHDHEDGHDRGDDGEEQAVRVFSEEKENEKGVRERRTDRSDRNPAAHGDEALGRVEHENEDSPAGAQNAVCVGRSDIPAPRRSQIDAAGAADPEPGRETAKEESDQNGGDEEWYRRLRATAGEGPPIGSASSRARSESPGSRNAPSNHAPGNLHNS